MLATAVRLSAGAVTNITARWSPYSLLILIAMCFISVILLAVLLILLISGRFGARREDEDDTFALALEDEETGPPEDEFADEAPGEPPETQTAPPALEDTATALAETPPPGADESESEDTGEPRPPSIFARLGQALAAFLRRLWRSNGLWQLLVAILAGPAAALCWMGLESIYGQLRPFTDCTLLLLLLLATQIIMVVQLWRRQRGR